MRPSLSSPLPFMLGFGVFNDTETRSFHLAFAMFLAFAAYPATRTPLQLALGVGVPLLLTTLFIFGANETGAPFAPFLLQEIGRSPCIRPSRLQRPAAWAIESIPAAARITNGKSTSTPASSSEVETRRTG